MIGKALGSKNSTPTNHVTARKIFAASCFLFFVKSCAALHGPCHLKLQSRKQGKLNRQESTYCDSRRASGVLELKKNNHKRNSKLSSIPEALQCLPGNQWGLYAVIASSAAAALRLERMTSFGKNLSGPVTAMLISAVLTNIGILPASGSIHLISLQVFVLKLATPLLLFGADLKKIFLETGIMLKAFLLGTLGTLLGSFIAMTLLFGPLNSIGLPGDSWKLASALTAKNIGGGLNFFAVAETFKVSPSAVATGLAVDNLLGLLYFPLVSSLGAPYDENRITESPHVLDLSNGVGPATDRSQSGTVNAGTSAGSSTKETVDHFQSTDPGSLNIDSSSKEMDEVEKLTSALALGFTIASMSDYISSRTGLPSVPVSTLLTVALATAAPTQLKQLIPSGELLGKLSLLFFFASVGNASGTISSTFAATGAASLVAFELILYTVHLAVILGIGGGVLHIPMPDLLLASNANIGNAATASSLASAKGWKSRILPAILVGTLGNAFATFAGLSLGSFVLRKIAGF